MEEEKKTFESFFSDIEKEKDLPPVVLDVSKSDSNVPPLSAIDVKKFESNQETFNLLIEKCKQVIKELPFQGKEDYQQVKDKIAERKIEFEESPSPYELSRQIGVIQVLKDELISIFADAHKNHIIRKRVYEILFDAYMAVSKEKSSDKRKGDATLQLSDFSLFSAEAEAFHSYCKQIIDNLESQHKTVSRRIACMQAQLTLGELATGGQELGQIEETKKNILKDIKDQAKIANSEPGMVEWDEK